MPVGVLVNTFAIAVGGIIGTLFASRLSRELRESLNLMFGLASMGMGITSLILMENLSAVILALILGTTLGIMIHLGERINSAAAWMQRCVSKVIKSPSTMPEEEFTTTLVTVIVLFCTSGTGIYGSIVSGMTGDHTMLIAKSVLDFFTAIIFAGSMGAVISLIAIPQVIIFLCLYMLAGVILPLTTPAMINDFKAAGGFMLIAAGFRIIKVRMFPTADMIPSMILVMPISWFWVTCIMPLLG